ncbi:MAG: hypothetical protein NT062_38115, partial [Proteobacteria bacterium]|nr:hypothetical protein [Pseudomonadota bacterium]
MARGAELDDVTARAPIAIGDRVGAVVELAEGDPVIRGLHRLVALVARLLRVARHLRVAGRAARRAAVRGLGVIAAKRDRVVDRTLGERQVIARRQRRQRRHAIDVAHLADPHPGLLRRAIGVVVTGHARLDPRRGVVQAVGGHRALHVTLVAADRRAAPIDAVALVLERPQIVLDQRALCAGLVAGGVTRGAG